MSELQAAMGALLAAVHRPRATATGAMPAAQAALALVAGAPPEEMATVADALVAEAPRLPLDLAGLLAIVAGALVEHGVGPEPLAPLLLEPLAAAVPDAVRFAALCRAADPELTGRAHDEVAAAHPALGRAWHGASLLLPATIGLAARSAAVRAQARARPGLLPQLGELAPSRDGARALFDLLCVLDDERLIALEPANHRGWETRIGGISDCAQLHVLLADAVSAVPPPAAVVDVARGVGPPNTEEEMAAAWDLYHPAACGPLGQLPASLDDPEVPEEHIVWDDVTPAELLVVEGARVLMLGSPLVERAWQPRRLFEPLVASLKVERILEGEAFDRWLALARGALLILALAASGCVRTTPFRRAPTEALQAQVVWRATVTHAGTGAPRLVDLDGDGTLDVVVGRGAEGRDGGVVALSGADGRVLWSVDLADQVYTRPTVLDVDTDGRPDVVVGGRHFDLVALRGRDGSRLWSLRHANPGAGIPERNLRGAVVVSDLDRDGVPELLAPQSGQYDDDTRLVGRLFVVSGASGHILRTLEMPDGRETYCLPAVVGGAVFGGSGGETLSGHLWRLALPDLRIEWRLKTGRKGLIGTPAVLGGAVVAAGFDGRLRAVDMESGAVRWAARWPGFETYASPATGRFSAAPGPDVATVLTRGTFPSYDTEAVVAWCCGRTGRTLASRRIGVMTAASAVAVDIDGDGFDETVVVANHGFGTAPAAIESSLLIYDGRVGKSLLLERRVRGLTHATPAVGDLDADGQLDLIHVTWGRVERLRLLRLPRR